ncbi:MAG: Gfo/Idh/MocA family protein [Pirellulales bacterium]
MTQKADGMHYAPRGEVKPVCGPGEFRFAAVGLDHGHIHGMCNGLTEAGGELVWVYDPDPSKVEAFRKTFPGAAPAREEAEVLEDPSLALVASAPVPCHRGPLGLRVLDHGKDYLTDKPPFTTLEQLEAARRKVAETGGKFAVYYSERLHAESAVHAGKLIRDGAIGRVLQVIGLGPHRLSPAQRPGWFWDRQQYGGILVDIGCHQIEQCLYFADARNARVLHSQVANYHHPEHPAFEDFGDASLLADNGASFYFRVDWFTPDGLGAWGDGRTIILGTDGYLELRKYLDIARDREGDQVYLVDHTGERRMPVHGKVGFPFFGQLILDCLHRTEEAMSQRHTFLAIELALAAQTQALRIGC